MSSADITVLPRKPSNGSQGATGLPKGMPPNYGQGMMPHVLTFQGMMSTVARTYRASDEALKDSYQNARFMRNDLVVMECVEARQRSAALLGWHLETDDENSQVAKKLVNDLSAIIRKTPRFMQYRETLLGAIWYGKYGCGQRYRWKQVDGTWRVVVDKWEPVNGDKIVYRFDQMTGTYIDDQVGIRIGAHTGGGAQGVKHWLDLRRDFIEATDIGYAYFIPERERPLVAIHTHQVEDGEWEEPINAGRIHGLGIRSRIYWTWYQKQEALAWLMEYLERSGFGIEIWYYPWGNDQAKEAVTAAATERIGNGRNIILVPRPIGDQAMNYGVDRLEPGMAGADVLKDILTTYFGHLIKRYIIGQTMTSESQPAGLGSGLADVQLNTYQQIIQYDAINLGETLTSDLVEPLRMFNFPELASVPVRMVIETESPDVESKLAAWKDAWEMGCKLREKDVMELIGAAMPEVGETVLKNPSLDVPTADGGDSAIPFGQDSNAIDEADDFNEEPGLEELATPDAIEEVVEELQGEGGGLNGATPDNMRDVVENLKSQHYAWDEKKHPRGQTENAGEFASVDSKKTARDTGGISEDEKRRKAEEWKQRQKQKVVASNSKARSTRQIAKREWDDYRTRHPRYGFIVIDYPIQQQRQLRESLSLLAEGLARQPGWSEEYNSSNSVYFRHVSGSVIRIADHHPPHARSFAHSHIYPQKGGVVYDMLMKGDISGLLSMSIAKALSAKSLQYEWDEKKHPRGKPENAGQFATKGGGVKVAKDKSGDKSSFTKKRVAASAKKPSGQTGRGIKGDVPAVKVTGAPRGARAFNGQPKALRKPLKKLETGDLGEEIILAYLQAKGMKDARRLNRNVNNYAIDAIQDHASIEVKAGQVSNGKSAQQWRLTIGEPGKAEKEWLKTASTEEKKKWNQQKAKAIIQRKRKALAALEKELGYKIKPKTMTVLIDPDSGLADIYEFDGWHPLIRWNSPEAQKAYKGTVKYVHRAT